MLKYATGNLVTVDTLLSVTSEDATTPYTKDKLYNSRPSKPFRFTANTGNQILIDLGAPVNVTIVSVVNHNLLAPTKFKIKAAAANPPGGGNWDVPDWSDDLALVTGIKNSYLEINQTYRYFLLDVDDGTNPSNTEVGEFILDVVSNFGSNFRVIAESEGIIIRSVNHVTHWGQPWGAAKSRQKVWTLDIFNQTAKGTIDTLETFLKDINGSAGRFLMIPDHNYGHSYYVLTNTEEFMAPHEFFNQDNRRLWNIPILEFPNGAVLL